MNACRKSSSCSYMHDTPYTEDDNPQKKVNTRLPSAVASPIKVSPWDHFVSGFFLALYSLLVGDGQTVNIDKLALSSSSLFPHH